MAPQDQKTMPSHARSSPAAGSSAWKMVGLGRLELPTSRLSSARSNQLSYKPEPENAYPEPARGTSIQYGKCPKHRQKSSKKDRAGSSRKKEKRRRRSPAYRSD